MYGFELKWLNKGSLSVVRCGNKKSLFSSVIQPNNVFPNFPMQL